MLNIDFFALVHFQWGFENDITETQLFDSNIDEMKILVHMKTPQLSAVKRKGSTSPNRIWEICYDMNGKITDRKLAWEVLLMTLFPVKMALNQIKK